MAVELTEKADGKILEIKIFLNCCVVVARVDPAFCEINESVPRRPAAGFDFLAVFDDIPIFWITSVMVCVVVLMGEFLQFVESPVLPVKKNIHMASIWRGLAHPSLQFV